MEWLSETTELLATVCENVIILWFLTAFFGSRYDRYKRIITFVVAAVITTVFTSLFSFAFPNEFLACTFGFISDKGVSLVLDIKVKLENCTSIENIQKLSELDLDSDFGDSSCVLAEESELIAKQIDFIISKPLECL